MRRISLLAAMAALSFSLTASAEVIFTISVPFKGVNPTASGIGPFLDEVELPFGAAAYNFGDPPPIGVPSSLFDGIRALPSDVGRSWVATAASDPDFTTVARLLTDGVSESVFSGVESFRLNAALAPSSSLSSSRRTEESLFSSLGGTDLAGYDLTAITERLDAMTITEDVTPDPSFPAYHGRQFEGQVTLSFEGTPVPEPGLGYLTAAAVGALLVRRSRAREGS
jgi:hypothetical protein